MLYNINMINILQKNRLLESPLSLGRVEAIFSSVCMIRTLDGLLLAVQNVGAVFSPMSLLAPDVKDFSNIGLIQGSPVYHFREKSWVKIGDIVFDYSKCQYYSTWAPITCHGLEYPGYLLMLEKYFQEREACLYHYLYGVPHETGHPPQVKDLLGRRIREAAELIYEGTQMDRDTKVKQGLLDMLGLGPGLTPSGDDFFLGLATALFTSKRHAGVLNRLKSYIMDLSQSRTTKVSHAFICYFLENSYSWPVFKLIETLNRNDLKTFALQLPAVGEFGYSSGLDYLCGLWLGFKFLNA